jgi:hypothetical protein
MLLVFGSASLATLGACLGSADGVAGAHSDGSAGATGGSSGALDGAPGTGGSTVSTSSSGGTPATGGATSGAAACSCNCVGGADAIPCDYVTVQFSDSVPTDGLDVEATTSTGDHLILSATGSGAPELFLQLSPDGSQALGVRITAISGLDYSPEWVSVSVRQNELPLADGRIYPTYACVHITGDDWCWKAAPETLQLALP